MRHHSFGSSIDRIGDSSTAKHGALGCTLSQLRASDGKTPTFELGRRVINQYDSAGRQSPSSRHSVPPPRSRLRGGVPPVSPSPNAGSDRPIPLALVESRLNPMRHPRGRSGFVNRIRFRTSIASIAVISALSSRLLQADGRPHAKTSLTRRPAIEARLALRALVRENQTNPAIGFVFSFSLEPCRRACDGITRTRCREVLVTGRRAGLGESP